MSKPKVSMQDFLDELVSREDQSPDVHLPDIELIQYRNGRLAAEAAERARVHLVACRQCRSSFLELSRLEQAIHKACRPKSAFESPARRSSPLKWLATLLGWPMDWRLRALATALLLGCLGIGFWNFTLRRSVTALSQPHAQPWIEDLYAVDDPMRDSLEGPDTLELSSSNSDLILLLHLPIDIHSPKVTVTILSSEGGPLWTGSVFQVLLERTVSLTIPRRFMPPGEYRLLVTPDGSGVADKSAEYKLRIQWKEETGL